MNGLLTLAAIPPLFLMHYVYALDSVEREPIGLIMKLFGLGMLSCIPAGLIESILSDLMSHFLDPYGIPGSASRELQQRWLAIRPGYALLQSADLDVRRYGCL